MPWSKLLAIVRELDEGAARELAMVAAPELAAQEVGKGKAGPGRGKKTGADDTRLSRGGNSSYLAARLRRDHPDLAAEVEAGRMKLRAAARKPASSRIRIACKACAAPGSRPRPSSVGHFCPRC
jgi:hypothetical protein